MKLSTFTNIISAAHVARFVDAPFEERGGIMIVAPVGHMKSTIITSALRGYSDVLRLSDLNVQSLVVLKESILSGRYNTIALGEFQKLYERQASTASNLEGHLRAMIDEGFGKASFQDQRANGILMRATLIAATTPTCYDRHVTHWLETGFSRRLLWLTYRLQNPQAIQMAIHKWQRLDMGNVSIRVPSEATHGLDLDLPAEKIPYSMPKETSRWLCSLLSDQPAKETGFSLLKKIYCVLQWRHGAKDAKRQLTELAPALTSSGGVVTIPPNYI